MNMRFGGVLLGVLWVFVDGLSSEPLGFPVVRLEGPQGSLSAVALVLAVTQKRGVLGITHGFSRQVCKVMFEPAYLRSVGFRFGGGSLKPCAQYVRRPFGRRAVSAFWVWLSRCFLLVQK